ncbi:MAG TPA: hypothetical protein ENG51_09945 [Deltaproteobacteria bacterium]|nr:MAG: hypothetical protein DRQ06_01065 [Candidatus Hydrothermae bacterium]HDM76777.1 hypothetical protein [Deltaproteobacteria bacterium]
MIARFRSLVQNEKYHVIFLGVIFGMCILLMLGRLYVTKNLIGGDAVKYFITLRSAVIDRDLWFKNEFEHFYNEISPFTGNRKIDRIPSPNPRTGRIPVKYPVGSALLLFPFFSITHLFLNLLRAFGFTVLADGYGPAYQFASAFGASLYAFLGIIVLYIYGKRKFGAEISLISVTLVWLATPLVYYMTMEPLMSHALSMFAVTLFLIFWLQIRDREGAIGWFFLGLAGGLMSIVRYQDALFLLIPAVDIAIRLFRDFGSNKTYIGKAFCFAASALSIIALQLFVNFKLFGGIFSTGYRGEGFTNWYRPKLLYSLFSTESGLLLWTPLVFFAFAGAYLWLKRENDRVLGFLLIGGFLVQLYLVSSWSDPSQGDSFGNRMLVNSTPLFGLWIMSFLREVWPRGRGRKWLLAGALLLVGLNALLMFLYCFRIIGNPY